MKFITKAERLRLAQEEHKKFLTSVGFTGKVGYKANTHFQPRKPPVIQEKPLSSVSAPCYSKNIFDIAQKESQHVRDEIYRKASRTAPAYNKGGYMYISDNADLTTLGRKV